MNKKIIGALVILYSMMASFFLALAVVEQFVFKSYLMAIQGYTLALVLINSATIQLMRNRK